VQSTWTSSMICNTRVITVSMASPSVEEGTKGKVDEMSQIWGEKQPKCYSPISSMVPTSTSLVRCDVGVVFNKTGKRESLIRATSTHSRKFPTHARQACSCSTWEDKENYNTTWSGDT
jgi:hypothetical protein